MDRIEKWVQDRFIAEYRDQSLAIKQIDRITKLNSFVEGDPWADGYVDDRKPKSWEYQASTNIAHFIHTLKSASIQYDKVNITLLPYSSMQVDDVTRLNLIIDTIWKRSNATKYIKEGACDGFKYPFGVTKMEFNDSKLINVGDKLDKGEVVIRTINPANFFWDPRATKISNCEFAFEITPVSVFELLNQPKFNLDDLMDDLKQEFISENDGYDIFTNIYAESEEFLTWLRSRTVSLFEIYWVYDVNIGNPKVAKIYLVNDHIIYKINNIGSQILPYSIFYEVESAHNFMGTNSVELTLKDQIMFNKTNTIRQNILTQMETPTTIIATKSRINPKMFADVNGSPGLVLITRTQPTESIYRLPVDQSTEDVSVQARDILSNIKMVAGITQFDMAEPTGSLATTGALNTVAEQNANNKNLVKIQFENYIRRLYQIMINLVVFNADGTEFRIDMKDPESNDEFAFTKLDAKVYKNMKMDIDVKVYVTQNELEKEKQNVMQLIQLQGTTGTEYVSPSDALNILLNDSDKKNMLVGHFQQRQLQEQLQEQQAQQQQQGTMLAVQAAVQFFQEQIVKTEQEGGLSPNTPLQQLEQEAVVAGMQKAAQYQQQLQEQKVRAGNAIGGGGISQSRPENIVRNPNGNN